MKLSNLSKTPPCPGIMFPLSFTPKVRFNWLSTKSPNGAKIETKTQHKVAFRQIAGYLARRIVIYTEINDEAKAGHELGFIKFGSRMDVFLPLDTEILCKIGDRTKGGEDIIARLKTNDDDSFHLF